MTHLPALCNLGQREYLRPRPRRLLHWSRCGVCLTWGGGRWENLQRLCYMSTGYFEESGEEGEEIKDDSEVLSLSLRMRVPLHAMTKSRWHLTWGKIVYCLL